MDKKGSTYIIRFVIENWWVDYFNACYNQISLKLYIEAIEDCSCYPSVMIVFKKFIKELLFFEGYFRVVTTHVCMAQPKRILSTLEKNTQA